MSYCSIWIRGNFICVHGTTTYTSNEYNHVQTDYMAPAIWVFKPGGQGAKFVLGTCRNISTCEGIYAGDPYS
eukprot:5884799-Amphidinium_carterae.2